MNQEIPLRHLKYTPEPLKQPICHTHIMGWFSAILVSSLLIHVPRPEAQAADHAGQDFASLLPTAPFRIP